MTKLAIKFEDELRFYTGGDQDEVKETFFHIVP
jgi:hypothetical protein